MARFKEYSDYDAIGLSALIESGEVTIQEVLDASFHRISLLNPKLNAIVRVLEESAAQQFEELRDKTVSSSLGTSLFKGVPIAVKDCVAGMRGVPQTFGTRLTKSYIPLRDEEIIRRYRNAGVLFVGQTNVPELSSSLTTESALYGPCNNPWNLNRTVGGSSGGSACAVASGMVPVATANDSAGSIRIPASCTGIFGFKPSRGRTPNGPDISEIWSGLFVQHVLTKTVRDSAAFLDVGHGLDTGAPYAAPAFDGSYLNETSRTPGKLKIAFSTKAMNDVHVDKSCDAAMAKTVKLLEELGHEVCEAEPNINAAHFFSTLEDLLFANLAYEIQGYAKDQNVKISSDTVEACNLAMVELGNKLPATALMEFFNVKAICERSMGKFFKQYDAYLTPTIAAEPIRHGLLNANSSDLRLYLDRFWNFSPFTALSNVSGIPSMSVPLHISESGLPVGSMFSMAYGNDDKLFRLAAQLERSMPWKHIKPSAI